MSRRFGRNQRRRLVDALNQANFVNECQLERIKLYDEDQAKQHKALKLVADILGPNFVALEPKTIQVENLSIPVNVFPFRNDESSTGVEVGAGAFADAVSFSLLQLDSITASHTINEMRDMVHFNVTTPSGELAYSFHHSTFSRMSFSDIKNQMIHKLAHVMTLNIEKAKKDNNCG